MFQNPELSQLLKGFYQFCGARMTNLKKKMWTVLQNLTISKRGLIWPYTSKWAKMVIWLGFPFFIYRVMSIANLLILEWGVVTQKRTKGWYEVILFWITIKCPKCANLRWTPHVSQKTKTLESSKSTNFYKIMHFQNGFFNRLTDRLTGQKFWPTVLTGQKKWPTIYQPNCCKLNSVRIGNLGNSNSNGRKIYCEIEQWE